jgi:hypothetical protein
MWVIPSRLQLLSPPPSHAAGAAAVTATALVNCRGTIQLASADIENHHVAVLADFTAGRYPPGAKRRHLGLFTVFVFNTEAERGSLEGHPGYVVLRTEDLTERMIAAREHGPGRRGFLYRAPRHVNGFRRRIA